MNAENLRRMSDYLKGPLQAEFNMEFWSDRPNECGTVGCVIGHASTVFRKHGSEPWSDFGGRVFGVRPWSNAFRWLFDSVWSKVDNTALGAAARIDYFLAHGVPSDWLQQMTGKAPLCYSVDPSVSLPLVQIEVPSEKERTAV